MEGLVILFGLNSKEGLGIEPSQLQIQISVLIEIVRFLLFFIYSF